MLLSAYLILLVASLCYAGGNTTSYHKHSGSIIYEQYSAMETELEKIVTLTLNTKLEENFENKLEERIFEKIQAKLERKVINKLNEIFSCCKDEITEAPVVSTDSDISEKEGNKVTLLCSIIGGIPSPTIKWRFGNSTIDSDVDRYRLLPDGALEITSLYLTDSGVYTCIGENTVGTAKDTVTLNVIEIQIAPQVMISEAKLTEMENKKVTLPCTFSGKPVPKISWNFGGTSIGSDYDRYRLHPDGSLEITFLYRNDTGVYTCLAQNPLGTAQTTVTLTVTWNNDWCPATSNTAASATNPVVAGIGVCGYHDLWVIRARHGTGLIPGKYDVHTTQASYAMDGVEYKTNEFEIFCSPDKVEWVKNTYGIPANAIIGGFTELGPSGDPLYIGRAVQGDYLTSGKVWNNVLYIPLNGVTHTQTSFEVLCRV